MCFALSCLNLNWTIITYLQTTLQALERSQRENNVLSERLGAVSSSLH